MTIKTIKTAIFALILPLFPIQNAFSADYEQFFLVNGQKVPPAAAIIAALNGKPTFKCVSVESKVSKTGTSIGIKNVKKTKAAKND